ncbi:MAG: orotate phosphoribosyltransferase [Thermomicrobiales bacterium]|jgi:orotate phosphoribosyltransferase|nr:orotate phosphoribosyltransferase [Thermomicrobiales bacterium]
MSESMMTIDPTILAQIRQKGLLREGHFAFRSGRHSAGLLDRDLLLADPLFASRLGYAIAKRFFVDHVDTVATPSIWGAGLAQWVAYFLEPKAKVVDATPKAGDLTIAEELVDLIRGRRVLLLDNLVISGQTMSRFASMVDELGATVIGIGTLWNSADEEIAGHPVFGLLNTLYLAYPTGRCPLCLDGAPPAEEIPY